MELCFDRDNFIGENKTIWVVDLSDGSRVFQDDNRPGLKVPNAWIRLGKHIKSFNGGLKIINFRLWFRSHKILAAPSSAPGYYFANGIEKQFDSSMDRGYYVTGWLLSDLSKVRCYRWKIPELLIDEIDDRSREKAIIEPFFIWN